MVIIDKTKPVMVTGATGYLASWIVKKLLDDGITVHATVRDPSDQVKVEHLSSIAEKSDADLKLFKADLLDPGSFDEAAANCELIIHTASPFFITNVKNPEEALIRPAREGTVNVLETVNRSASAKRVVLTSSVVAVYGDSVDIEMTSGGKFTESDWNTTSSPTHRPYPFSKTVAEKEAWKIAGKQEQWDLVTINPGWILGPSLTKRVDSASIKTMIEFADGTYKSGVPRIWNPMVDVRDVAMAHIKAGVTPEASGRHILVSEEATLLDLGKILRKNIGDQYPFPTKEPPKFLLWLIAPMIGFTRKWAIKNVGYQIRLDNSYSKKDLGMTYIPLEKTVKDHFQQILDDGLLEGK
jgi:nucleoside-diphosphate-sugar epimerase